MTDRGWDTIGKLRNFGVMVGLDDYGKGANQSELLYGHKSDIDLVKIDMKYAKDLLTPSHDSADPMLVSEPAGVVHP